MHRQYNPPTASGGRLNALLLKIGPQRQGRAAAKAADDQIPAVMGPGLCLRLKVFFPPEAEHRAKSQQKDERNG